MKNILFLGPYKQSDGWGTAAKEYLRAMRLTNNVKAVYVETNGSAKHADSPEFADLENNNFPHYDCVIQNVLPPGFCYDARVGKNIGLVHYEAEINRLDINKFKISASLMDEIWSPFNTGFSKTRLLPVPTDVNKFTKKYEIPHYIPQDTFNIYFIGEDIGRKNIDSLCLAFHYTFNYNDDVNLIIKTGRSGLSAEHAYHRLQDRLTSLKETWGLYKDPSKYKKEVIITGSLTEEELYGVHTGCHMMVMPSSGESQSMPVLDAIGFNNMIATTEGTGPYHTFRYANNHFCIRSEKSIVESFDKPIPSIYTANESWYTPNIGEISRIMRSGYKRYQDGRIDKKMNLQTILDLESNFSYRAIGDRINEYLA